MPRGNQEYSLGSSRTSILLALSPLPSSHTPYDLPAGTAKDSQHSGSPPHNPATASHDSKGQQAPGKSSQPEADGQLVKAEGRALGAVDSSVYGGYAAAVGWPTVALILLAFTGGQALLTATDYWLSQWARAAPEQQSDSRWLWVYGAMTGAVGGAARLPCCSAALDLMLIGCLLALSACPSACLPAYIHSSSAQHHTSLLPPPPRRWWLWACSARCSSS